MDRCYETYFVQYLFWLLVQRQEQLLNVCLRHGATATMLDLYTSYVKKEELY